MNDKHNANILHPTAEKAVGAVMVVGGGIGGIQASLDLAESGFKVYMVESSPTIGGVMAQLDKTFPTNDCSMCIVSPKLVECGRHLNIEIITCAQVAEVSGQALAETKRMMRQPLADHARATLQEDLASIDLSAIVKRPA